MAEISIVIPIFNTKTYLRRCLETIRNQSFLDIEVIMINDGSIDGCEEVCKEYVENDKRFRYFYQENKGVSSARNLGIRNSIGRYISFIDSDDYVSLDYCEKIYNAIESQQVDMLVFGIIKELEENFSQAMTVCEKDEVFEIDDDSILEYFCRKWLKQRNVNYIGGKLYKRKIIVENDIIFPEKIKLNEDRIFNYRILPHIRKVGYIKDTPYHYCQNSNSICHTIEPNDDLIKNAIKLYEKIIMEWEDSIMFEVNSVYKIILIRMLQASFYFIKQSLNDLTIVANHVNRSKEENGLIDLLEIKKTYEAICIYSDKANLSWNEKVKELLFTVSLLDGKDGIIEWQEMYSKI